VFQENLEAANRKLAEEQRSHNDTTRQKNEIASKLRLAEQRAADAERERDDAQSQLQEARQKADAAAEVIQRSVVLERQAYEDREKMIAAEQVAAKLGAQLEQEQRHLIEARDELAAARLELDETRAKVARADRIIEAWMQVNDGQAALAAELS
jgi:hypothetical protein